MDWEAKKLDIVEDQGGFFYIRDGSLYWANNTTVIFCMDTDSAEALKILSADAQAYVQEVLEKDD